MFALGLLVLGVVALGELYTLMGRVRPPALAGFLTLAALIAAALYGEPRHVLMVLVAAFPLVFLFALLRPRREHVAWAMAATFFGVLWVGLPMAHAVFLRELRHRGRQGGVTGMGLVIDVLVATFLGDTGAYFVGRTYGRTRLAPLISPNKTLEGLAGGIAGATARSGCARALPGLADRLARAAARLPRGAGGAGGRPVRVARQARPGGQGHRRLFGAHGGVLDRLDAVFFTILVGYYAALALGYG